MKTAKKTVLLVLSAIALVVASVFGTLAYLTDTDEVVNTFTVGNVDIFLDEAKVDEYGNTVDAEGNAVALENAPRVEENAYRLLPGRTYVKDPTVTVVQDSDEAYVRMIVTVSFEDLNAVNALEITKIDSIFVGNDNTKWVREGEPEVDAANNTITYEYRYFETVKRNATGNTELPALFEKIVVPSNLNNVDIAALAKMKINVVAHAIQADGFATADDAWTAFNGQLTAGEAPAYGQGVNP